MHELSIAQSIVEVVERRARECQAARVTCVRLQVGEANGVFADPLAFSFEMLADLSPPLKGARLVIDTVPHRARCRRCEQEFAVENCVPRCPVCEEWSADILSGTELQIVAMDCELASEQVVRWKNAPSNHCPAYAGSERGRGC